MTNSLSFSVSLIFYEEVKDINICHALHTLQKMYTTEVEVVGGASSIRRTRNEQRPRSSQVFSLFCCLRPHSLLTSRASGRKAMQARYTGCPIDMLTTSDQVVVVGFISV